MATNFGDKIMSKQIINGIDVSEWELKGVLIPITECKYFEGIGNCKETKCLCVDNKDCYFKKLKHLEVENEAYKLSENEAKEIMAELEHENKCLQEENEKLRQDWRLDCLKCEYKNTKADVDKYKQALEEIKKWATNHNPCDTEADINCTKEDCFECLNYDIKKITKIINEALNDTD